MSDTGSASNGTFPATRWSLVGRAAGASPEERKAALSELVGRYLPPLKVHLMAHRRLRAEDADDVLQSFLASRVLAENIIERADRARGRFRAFLVTALDRFFLNELRDSKAQKRAPEHIEALQEYHEPAGAGEEAMHVEVAWARQVLASAIERMKGECQHRPELWGIFEARVLAPTLDGAEPVPLPQLVRQFALDSPAQASNLLVTANRMFVRTLRAVIGEYEPSAKDIDAEMEDLRRVLSTSGRQ